MKIRVIVFVHEQSCSFDQELDEDDPRSWGFVCYQSSTSTTTTTGMSTSRGTSTDPDTDTDTDTSRQKGVEEEKETPVSTIRIVPPPHTHGHPNGFVDPDEEVYVKLGRVATIKESRGLRLGVWLCEEAFKFLRLNPDLVGGIGVEGDDEQQDIGSRREKEKKKWKGLVLTHAQVEVEKVYQKIGFVTDERLGRWDEEGIEHLGMWKRLDIDDGDER